MKIRLRRARHFFDVAALLSVRKTYPLSPEFEAKTRERFEEEMAAPSSERWIFLGYDQRGEAVAYAQLLLREADNDPELARAGEIAHIYDLRVCFDRQGEGIGRAVVEGLLEEAAKASIEVMTLGVENHNPRAIKLYENLGFETFKVAEGRTENEWVFYMRRSTALSRARSNG